MCSFGISGSRGPDIGTPARRREPWRTAGRGRAHHPRPHPFTVPGHLDWTGRVGCAIRVGGMNRQQEFVLRAVEEREIRFIRLGFTDILGYLKSVMMSPSELEGAFEEGVGFDGSSIEGLSRISESDTI